MDDRELAIMAQITGLIAELEDGAHDRVVRWLIGRYSSTPPSGRALAPVQAPRDFASLIERAEFEGDDERALLACFWVQELEGANPFDSQKVNAALKELGYGVSNITRALRDLHEQRPALVMAIRKEGRTRQARKQYRVTIEGLRRARQMAHLA